jgi:hypothetical protein
MKLELLQLSNVKEGQAIVPGLSSGILVGRPPFEGARLGLASET